METEKGERKVYRIKAWCECYMSGGRCGDQVFGTGVEPKCKFEGYCSYKRIKR